MQKTNEQGLQKRNRQKGVNIKNSILKETEESKETDRLLQLLLNEDSLILGRTNYFLLANSFLITAFMVAFTSQETPWRTWVCSALGILGIAICVLQRIAVAWTYQVWKILEKMLKKRSLVYKEKREKEGNYPIFEWRKGATGIARTVYPLIFTILWVFFIFLSWM